MTAATEGKAEVGKAAPVLRLERASRYFGSIIALEDVSLAIHAGEVVGLVGDNGAGKSTLVKLVAGVYQPSDGHIEIDGEPADLSQPEEARRRGIETVYQDLALVNELRVDGNLFLGREPTRGGFFGKLFGVLDLPAMERQARASIEELHVRIPSLKEPVRRMSGGQRQGVAIARAVHWGSKLLLLDEPTAALGREQSDEVRHVIRQMRDRRIPVLVISHNLPDIFAVCDRIVVLRQGRLVADLVATETDMNEVVAYMVGSKESAVKRETHQSG